MSREPTQTGNAARHLVSIGTATATVLATVLALPAAAAADDDGPSDRVLQSVSLGMSSDGSLTRVDGTVVRTDGSAEDAETSEEAYAPNDVVADVPVRVLTTYRTAEGAGTDLSDLEGYTGRVAIDLTVQNLTVRPQMISYDVAGSSRQQAALVGSPLTVTASTALDDLKPSRIVTDDGSGANVTNGVLGTSADGTTVQWAALLAPPTLSSSAELSLVVDAKDFEVPSFDLSVQPGLVTDPSIGALVDSAFNPANSSELDLQRRTIDLIGQVNDVLARASSTITDVRTSLNDSAATLGTQTVADLQSSTQSVTTNMRSLDAALQSLRQDLGSTLDSTGSSAVAELTQAAAAVDKLLGDTSAPVPTVGVDENGCRTTVAAPRQTRTVYGNLLQVSSQLDGYAQATGACRAQLSDSLLATIGPDRPTEQTCLYDSSVTCSLFGATTTFSGIADDLRRKAEKTIELLEPTLYEDALEAANAVTAEIKGIESLAQYLDYGRLIVPGKLSEIRDLVKPDNPATTDKDESGDLVRAIAAVGAGLRAIHTDAVALKNSLALDNMRNQATKAASELCAVDDGSLTDTQRAQLDLALSYLSDKPCNDRTWTAPDDFPTPLERRLDSDLYPQLDSIIASSDTQEGAQGAAAAALANIEEARGRILEIVQSILELRRGPDDMTLDELGLALKGAFERLHDDEHLGAFNTAVEALQEKAKDVPDIKGEINTLVGTTQSTLTDQIGEDTRKVSDARRSADEKLGSMFEQSAGGMEGAADTIIRNGREALRRQQSDLAAAQKQAGNRITDTIEKGLGQINSGVSASTRDMEAATTLLTADLRRVLLDLGERRVGGGGLLGAMSTNAATARSADYQLALAADTTTAYANVRDRDIAGIMLRQAQTDAAMQMLAELPAFQLDLPAGSQHRTVYSFSIGAGQ